MIANFTSGSDSDALARYLMGYGKGEKSDKQAVVLSSAGVRTDTLAHLVADFELGRKLHPELEKSVLHISLSFNPDDAARMTNQKMRQVADDYMEQMDLKGTQYLVVRHRDRPHQHLHIMANRVSDDGHTVQDGNNFFASKKALEIVVAKHELTPAKGSRPHLQHPERLRGKDMGKHEMRQMLRPAMLAETQRPALLTALEAQGLKHQLFLDKDGNAIGISFKKGDYACKGSALGPEFSLVAIDRQLAANQQKALEAVSGQTQSSILPDSAPTAARAFAAQSLVAQVVPGPAGEELQSPVSSQVSPPAGAGEAKPSEVSGPVEERVIPLVETVVATVSTQQSEQSAQIQEGTASLALSVSSAPVEAPADGEPKATVAPATPVEQPASPGAEVSGLGSVVPAGTDEVLRVETATEVSPVASGQEAQAHPRLATRAEPSEWELKLADWEHQQEQQAHWDQLEERYYSLLEETTRKIAVADQGSYQSLPAFVVLMQAQGLALLPAQGEEPVRVVHQSSGQEFLAEDILLAGRPFLDTVQTKATRGAEAAAAQSSPALVDWESRYQHYMQQRDEALTHNKAIHRVDYILEKQPSAAGVLAAMAMVQSPGTPELANGHLLQSLQIELTRQQDREAEIRWVAKEQARLQEATKGLLGLFTKASTEARDQLRYLEAPPALPIQVGALRYLLHEPPALNREQFAQQQQPGLEQVRANVKAALTAGFTQWDEFKAQVDSKEIEAILSKAGELTFRHKSNGQTYQPDEIIPDFKSQYDAAKARGQAQEARQPQRSMPEKSKDQGYSR